MIIWIIFTLIINVSDHFYIDLSVLKALSIDLLDNYNADTNSLTTGNNDLDTNSLNTGNNDLTSEGEGDDNISNNIEGWREMIPPMNEEEEWQPLLRINDEEEVFSDIEEEEVEEEEDEVMFSDIEEEEEEEEEMFRVNDEEMVTASAMHEELDVADEEWRHDCTTMAREVYETGELHIYEKVYAKFEASELADHERMCEFIRDDVVNDDVQLQSELDTQLKEHQTLMETLPDLATNYIQDLASGAIDSTRGPVADLDSLISPAPVEENTTSCTLVYNLEKKILFFVESAPIDDTTSSLLESAPIEDTTPVQESIPVEYTTPVQESIPVEDTTSGQESIAAEDTTSVQESIAAEDTTSGQESIAAEDTAVPAPAPAPTEEPAAPNVDHPVSKKRNFDEYLDEDLPVSKKRNFDEYSDEDPDYELESSSGKGNKRNKTGS